MRKRDDRNVFGEKFIKFYFCPLSNVGVANTLNHIIGFFHFVNASIFVSDTPLSPMGPSSPSQEGLFTDLRLLSLEKQLNIELKVLLKELLNPRIHFPITSR